MTGPIYDSDNTIGVGAYHSTWVPLVIENEFGRTLLQINADGSVEGAIGNAGKAAQVFMKALSREFKRARVPKLPSWDALRTLITEDILNTEDGAGSDLEFAECIDSDGDWVEVRGSLDVSALTSSILQHLKETNNE